ncbi:translation initiation factor IF-2 [Patescibacteria group bacterium]
MVKKTDKKETKQKESILNIPPVVVVLGHVDSGKTSILDYIRKTSVTAKESGGITQHIGAYQIEIDNKKITFLDTPGHEAFSAMRGRGAKIADIAVLVIDGAEGVKPQTKEAISHIKLADIPFIVAFNKIDKTEANPEKLKKELIKEDIMVESLGGKIPSVNISAKTGKGIPELLDLISLIGEMENLQENASKPAEGVVIESHIDSKRGPVATVILSNGTFKTGDIIGTQSTFGKIKTLESFLGNPIEKIFPSDPAVIIGLPEVPKVGEIFKFFDTTDQAKEYLKIAEEKKEKKSVEAQEGQKILNLILKTDMAGSIEAIEEVLKGIPQDKIILNILKAEVGDINESDAKTAKSSRSLILGFRIKVTPVVKKMVERDKIKILTFDIIYDLIEGLRKFMESIMTTETVRIDIGKIRVLAVFLSEKNRQVVGGRVSFGEVTQGSQIEVLRNEEIIGKGKIINLQKNKKNAEKTIKGEECGVLYEGDVKIEIGDALAVYREEKQKMEL